MASSHHHHGKSSSLRDYEMKLTTTKHIIRGPSSSSSSNMLLKDYLTRDDLSSCSSNGFKSFPRRQCCSTVRFQKDLHAKRNRLLRPSTTRSYHCSFKVASSTISALHKASRAVINAVKLLPSKNNNNDCSSSSSSMRRLLSKSLSRKMLSRSFWTNNNYSMEEEDNEADPHPPVPRWKSFREFLEEKEQPSDQHTHSSSNMTTMSVTSKGNTWGSSSDFTWPTSDTSDVVRVFAGENNNKVENTVTTAAAAAKTTTEDSTDCRCTLEKLMVS